MRASTRWVVANRVVVIGGGTGGTLAANRLRRALGPRDEVVVLDADDRHLYQPGLLFVPFGLASPARLVRPRSAQLRDGVVFRQAVVDQVDLDADTVVLADGTRLRYDALVVASGSRLLPEETEGLTGAGWGERVHTFYSLPGAAALAAALARFEGGRLVVDLVDLPVKCPVAPLEFCFLADWFLHRKGVRSKTKLTYVTSPHRHRPAARSPARNPRSFPGCPRPHPCPRCPRRRPSRAAATLR